MSKSLGPSQLTTEYLHHDYATLSRFLFDSCKGMS
jgi:hypothetical protein